MDPWKRYRLLACVVVILAVLTAGGMAWLFVGVTKAPYGYKDNRQRSSNPLRELRECLEPGRIYPGDTILLPDEWRLQRTRRSFLPPDVIIRPPEPF